MTLSRTGPAAALATTALAGLASAIGPELIYCNILSQPTSLVPGLGSARFQGFARPYRSPDGSRWIIKASLSAAPGFDLILVGTGTSGTVVVREGIQLEPLVGGLTGPIDFKMGITDDGSFAFTTNLSFAAAFDEVVAKFDADLGFVAVVARESDPVPGVPGEIYGATLDSAGITNAGEITFRAIDTVGTAPNSQDDVLIKGGVLFAQTGQTVPTGQAGGTLTLGNRSTPSASTSAPMAARWSRANSSSLLRALTTYSWSTVPSLSRKATQFPAPASPT